MTFSLLGVDTQTNQSVRLQQAARRQGTYIIGAPGTGKSGLIENLVIEDIKQGLGVCLLDPHGDLIEAILKRLPGREQDVILLDILQKDFPFGLNLFSCNDLSDSVEVQKTVDQIMHIFELLFAVSLSTPRMAQYLRNCTHTLIANPGFTMAEIPLLLTDTAFRKRLLANVHDTKVQLFWKTYEALKPQEQLEYAESTLNKLDPFLEPLSRNIVGQSNTTIDFRSVMDERKILLVKLNVQLSGVTSLLGASIIAQLLNAAYSRSNIDVSKRKQFNIYADEFQRFTTQDFSTLIAEARKFGIATTIAHQFRNQLDKPGDDYKAAALTAANLIVFRVSGEDAAELAPQFDCTPTPSAETRREQVLTVKYDAVTHLLTNGYADKNGNTNKIIDDFISTKLIRLQEPADYQALGKQWLQVGRQKLNNLLYTVMSENNPYKEVDIDIFLFLYFTSYSSYPSFPYYRYEWYGPPLFLHILAPKFALRFPCNKPADDDEQEEYVYEPFWGERERELQKKWSDLRKQANESFPLLWTGRSDQEVKQVIQTLYQACYEVFPQYSGFLKSEGTYAREIAKIKEKLAYKPDALRQKQQEAERLANDNWYFTRTYEEYVRWMKSTRQRPIKKEREYLQEKQQEIERFCQELRNDIEHDEQQIASYRQEMPVLLAKSVAAETQEAITSLTKDSAAFEAAIFEFRSILQILAHDPIMGPSGQYEEKPIPRTFQDREKEIANELSSLPDHRAKVRIKNVTDGAIVEHTIQTIAPERKGVLRGTALQQRIASIQYRNLTDGYIRPRKEVEEEIMKRQSGQGNAPNAKGPQGNNPSPSPQGQAGSPPPRRVKLDPDEEQDISCKHCGTQNRPKAKFCNECGKRL